MLHLKIGSGNFLSRHSFNAIQTFQILNGNSVSEQLRFEHWVGVGVRVRVGVGGRSSGGGRGGASGAGGGGDKHLPNFPDSYLEIPFQSCSG